jgi:hypothetical protein
VVGGLGVGVLGAGVVPEELLGALTDSLGVFTDSPIEDVRLWRLDDVFSLDPLLARPPPDATPPWERRP